MRFIYADPPYPGMASLYPEKQEVDHAALILQLEQFDGWALSTASTTLKQVLALCPEDVRISPWIKPWVSFKPGINPGYAWEPIIWKSRRRRGRAVFTLPDYVIANATTKRGLKGAKPDPVCFWLFQALNIQPGDEFIDLFRGTGAVSRAYAKWQRQIKLIPDTPLRQATQSRLEILA